MYEKSLNPQKQETPQEPSDWDKLTNPDSNVPEFVPPSFGETSDDGIQIDKDGTIVREKPEQTPDAPSEESEN